MIRISMLGASSHTKRVEPAFPLLFHESFHFRKTLIGVSSLAGLQAELARQVVLIQLVQWQGCRCMLLASFCSSLSEVLYPQPAAKRLLAGVDIDLLMEPTACFPGIIAPKVEVSTKVVVEEIVKYPIVSYDAEVVNRTTLTSKRTVKKNDKGRMRQKPVCHTRPHVKCYYCDERVERQRGGGGGKTSSPQSGDTLYLPYCNKCGDVVEETEVKQGKIIMKDSANVVKSCDYKCTCAESPRSKSACDCTLCQKYNDMFNNSSSQLDSSLHVLPQKKSVQQSPCPKGKICSRTYNKPKYVERNYRLTAGDDSGVGCTCCEQPSSPPTPYDCSRNEDYRQMLEADLDTHYKEMYQRVCRRCNTRDS